jgi:hypothetical protein
MELKESTMAHSGTRRRAISWIATLRAHTDLGQTMTGDHCQWARRSGFGRWKRN